MAQCTVLHFKARTKTLKQGDPEEEKVQEKQTDLCEYYIVQKKSTNLFMFIIQASQYRVVKNTFKIVRLQDGDAINLYY